MHTHTHASIDSLTMNDITAKMNEMSINLDRSTPPGTPRIAKCPDAPQSKSKDNPQYIKYQEYLQTLRDQENWDPNPSKIKKSLYEEGYFDVE